MTRIFGTAPEADWGPGFLLGAFEHPVLPVLMELNGRMSFVMARWGLIPPGTSWESGKRLRTKTLNARSEGLWDRPSFREAAASGRVLIPFTGFFEWQAAGKARIPYFFTFSQEGQAGAFAGLAAASPEPGGPGYTFTLITAPPNSLVGPIHSRSPLRVMPRDWPLWLDPSSRRDQTEALLVNGEWPDMTLRRAAPLVSRLREDRNRPEVLNPWGEDFPPVDGQLSLF